MTLLFSASWVVPVTAPAIREGAVAVSDGRIVWVGRAGDRDAPPGERRELGRGVLLPGLVNAHCHLELSYLRGELDASQGFVAWVEALVGRRGSLGRDGVREAASSALGSLVESGTAAVGDVSNTLDHLDLLERSGLSAVVFHELLGWDPSAAQRILDEADARLGTARERLRGTRVRVEPAAHAPHSVSAELFRGLAARGGPAAVHLAESPEESVFLTGGGGAWRGFLERRGLGGVEYRPPGRTPVAYLEELGALHPGLVAAHCVQVGPEDAKILARRGVHVALCPRSNRNLGVGVAPVAALREAGVALCLGTDSLASVETLELIDDAAALHRDHPGLDPRAIVGLATRGGAAALGFADLGALAPGFRAEMAFAPAERVPAEPCAFLVAGEARPRRVAA